MRPPYAPSRPFTLRHLHAPPPSHSRAFPLGLHPPTCRAAARQMSRCSTRGRPWHVTRSKARRRRPGAQRPPRRRRTRSAEAGGVHGGRRLPPHLLAELLGVRCVSKGGFLGGSCLLVQLKKKWVTSPGPGPLFYWRENPKLPHRWGSPGGQGEREGSPVDVWSLEGERTLERLQLAADAAARSGDLQTTIEYANGTRQTIPLWDQFRIWDPSD
eukprot:scaffold80640_cov71-Phaeocystis_antarctica.AAC.1